MSRLTVYLALCLLAGLLPLFSLQSSIQAPAGEFPGWPEQVLGRELQELALGEREQHFVEGFPGRIQRFGDGRREYILRWVTRPTRQLHAAVDCLRGVGFQVTPGPLQVLADGATWGRFDARRGAERLRVYERIYDSAGNSWSDVSAWYWAAQLGRSQGPWWSVVIAENPGDVS